MKHQLPRHALRYPGPRGPLGPISTRSQWVIEQSERRFERRTGSRPPPPMRGEIGTFLGMRIIPS